MPGAVLRTHIQDKHSAQPQPPTYSPERPRTSPAVNQGTQWLSGDSPYLCLTQPLNTNQAGLCVPAWTGSTSRCGFPNPVYKPTLKNQTGKWTLPHPGIPKPLEPAPPRLQKHSLSCLREATSSPKTFVIVYYYYYYTFLRYDLDSPDRP